MPAASCSPRRASWPKKSPSSRARMKLADYSVALTGGLFENQPAYRRQFQSALRSVAPRAKSFLLTVPGVVGAARIAGLSELPQKEPMSEEQAGDRSRPAGRLRAGGDRAAQPPVARPRPALDPATRRSLHPGGTPRRKRPARPAPRNCPRRHARREKAPARADASSISARAPAAGSAWSTPVKCRRPSTRRLTRCRPLIAGGPAAVFRSQEGAEDSREAGAAELRARGLTQRDVVCGIAASGQTPYVLGALEFGPPDRRGHDSPFLQSAPAHPRARSMSPSICPPARRSSPAPRG